MNGLRMLLEGSPFGILVIDSTGILRILNPCARRLVTTIGNPIESFTEAIPVVDLHRMIPMTEDAQVVNTVLARKQRFKGDVNSSSERGHGRC